MVIPYSNISLQHQFTPHNIYHILHQNEFNNFSVWEFLIRTKWKNTDNAICMKGRDLHRSWIPVFHHLDAATLCCEAPGAWAMAACHPSVHNKYQHHSQLKKQNLWCNFWQSYVWLLHNASALSLHLRANGKLHYSYKGRSLNKNPKYLWHIIGQVNFQWLIVRVNLLL